jgi:hypothetical protein
MSAAQIIEEFQKLPASEQEQVLTILQLERSGKSGQSDVGYVSDSDFEKSADHVLREHAELFRRLAQ